jgi:hypothetical protein
MNNQDQSPPTVSPQLQDQITRVTTLLVGYVVAYGVGKGWITPQNATADTATLIQLIVPIVAAGHVAWVLFRNSRKAKITAVQAMPGVQVVTSIPEVKAAVPDVQLTTPSQPTVSVTVQPVPKV